ncbi:unnamed protein product [Effrenium voratum]|nr:unnamed protein product [Effrenium voratum]
MKDRKKGRPPALLEWEQVQSKLKLELVRRKRGRLQANLGILGHCMWLLQSRLSEARQQAADRQRLQEELEAARARLTLLEDGRASFVESRAEEIRRTLEERRDQYLQAVLKLELPHWGTYVSPTELLEVVAEISRYVHPMIANCALLISGMRSDRPHIFRPYIVGPTSTLEFVFAVSAEASASVWALSLPFTLALAALRFARVSRAAAAIRQSYDWVNRAYVEKRFTEIYELAMRRTHALAELEYQAMLQAAREVVTMREESVAAFEAADLEALVAQGFRATFEELRKEHADLEERCQRTVGSALGEGDEGAR